MHDSCPVCRRRMRETPLQPLPGVRFLCCDDCVLGRLSVAHDEAYAAEQMQTIFIDAWDDSHTVPTVDIEQVIKTARRRARLARSWCRGRRLLEVGPGHGLFLREAAQHGFDASGADLSPKIAEHASRYSGRPVHVGPIENLPPQSFDAVVALHVVEHVTDPIAFVEAIHALLRPEGIALLAVPNWQCWESRLSGWSSYLATHLSYFSPRSFRRVLDRAGLRIAFEMTVESYAGWVNAVRRSLQRQEASLGGVPMRVAAPRPLLSRLRYLLGEMLLPLRVLQEVMHRGEELVVVAERRR